MDRQRDLELLLRSRAPLIVVETRDETQLLALLGAVARKQGKADYLPLFRWSLTDGLQRLDIAMEPQLHNAQPADVLRHIRAVTRPGIYVLLDFHPFLADPVHIRLLKDLCLAFGETRRQIVLTGHRVDLPEELRGFSARFELALPTDEERASIVQRVASEWTAANAGTPVKVDRKAYGLLIRNLAGLADTDTERLARNAVFQDGAISHSDIREVMQAKYELLNRGGTLQFEYETAAFGDVGGLSRLKEWLTRRRPAFAGAADAGHLDVPKGVLLIGVQGCGKSLAAKATAGIFAVPLLRLDFGALYNKYHGETERNLRESLRTADVMSPCVLWIDEIEKGLAGRGGETGTTQRVLATFLTWLAEKSGRVFVVATANDIQALPPELIRKGRFDEIFFVDLPRQDVRQEILAIHMERRRQAPDGVDLEAVARAAEGFSGAELEQVVVAALYAAHAQRAALTTGHLLEEVRSTRPLSVVMAEEIAALRQWADRRTVPCD